MIQSSTNISLSISLVRKELEATLQKAEGYFTQYAEERGEPQLRLFADELNLARGTFKLLELKGAEAICTEMLSLIGETSPKFEVKLDALGQALISLNRYISLILDQDRGQPILLVPAINLVRKAGGHKPISEAHFFTVNLRPRLPVLEKSGTDIRHHLSRLRLMYQVGLLRILKVDEPSLGLKLIYRAVSRLERGMRGTSAWGFWWVSQAAIHAMTEEDYEFTLARRMLFGRIDLMMRTMIKKGLSVFTEDHANELLKDLLQIIALSESKHALIFKVRQLYKLPSDTTEAMLKSERDSMRGPDIGAFDSLTRAFGEEIGRVKESLDLAARGGLRPDGYDRLQNQLSRLADVLGVINQDTLSKRLKHQKEQVAGLANLNDDERADGLAEIADSLLQVELATKNISEPNQPVEPKHEPIGEGHFSEARIILFDEIESGLALAKRAIASFADSNDKLHLANVKQSLDGLRGALIFLDQPQACGVIEGSIKYLEKRVLSSELPVDEAKLEALADALASVEYYIETLSKSDKVSKDILNLAIQSVGQLGYKVA